MIRRTALLILLACSNASYAAGIYKWVNDKGYVHYSATPPSEETTYENLHETLVVPRAAHPADKGAPPSAGESPESGSGTEDKDSKQANLDRETLWKQNCGLAQKNLEALQSERDVVRTDDNGDKTLLNAEQRQQALAQARKDIEYYCKP